MIKQLSASSDSHVSSSQLLTANARIALRPESTKWVFDRIENLADIDQLEEPKRVDPAINQIVKTIQSMFARQISQLEVSHSERDITISGTVSSYHARQLAEQGAKSVACQCEQRKFVSRICVVKDGASAARHITR